MTAVPVHVESLSRAWEARDAAGWSDPARFIAFGMQAVALGAPALAFDIFTEAAGKFPAERRLRYLTALALAKGGSDGQAARLLRELMAAPSEGPLQAEVLSLAGRIAKDRWSRLPEGAERTAAGNQARGCYCQAFELSRDPFPGINAATMCVLTGQAEEGRRIAAEVRAMCSGHAETADPWLHASMGEASLLLGDQAAAIDAYRRAAHAAAHRHGDIASMRRQLRLLETRVQGAEHALRLLAVPRVAIFTGHMIDAPGRPRPRFPEHIEGAVTEAIAALIAEHDVGFAYCSAACGADIIFAEQALEHGAEIDIVLPFQRDDFVRASVAFAGGRWTDRFERILERAANVTYCVEEQHLGDDVLFTYAAELTAGLALLRAEQLEAEPILLALAEQGDEGGIGGTSGNIRRWQSQGRQTAVVDLRRIREAAPAAIPSDAPLKAAKDRPAGLPWGRRQIRTMLFADMVGYSKLREHQTPQFFVHFLGALERELAASGSKPAFGNTWGDGLYLVFDQASEGADFALRLRDAIARVDWAGAGLPADMNIRIGMHTGPVFRTRDPIIGQENFFGSHVTRAARIEPVAAPGSVYVSEQMAAALAATGERRFAADYLGSISLAKQFGSGRIYRLRRATEAE